MRRWPWWYFGAACVIALAWAIQSRLAPEVFPPSALAAGPETAAPTPPNVETVLPVRKTLYRRLVTSAEIVPNRQAAIYARVQGYVDDIPVDRGTWVKEGDLLARLSVPDLDRDLARQEAELALCGPTLAREEAALRWREATFHRLEAAAAKTPQLVNAEALDDARGKFETAKAEADLAKAREATARESVEKTRAMLAFATLRAPFSGIVTDRWIDPGGLVQPAITRIVQVMDIETVRLRLYAPEPDVPSIAAGNVARVTIDELPALKIEAKVSRIGWTLNPSTKTMTVELDVENKDHAIRPGMYARVNMNLEAHENALTVPSPSLVVERKKTFLYLVRDGKAAKVPVKTGLDDGIDLEILDGLTDQDEVIAGGKQMVSDGVPVKAVRKTP